MENLQFGRLNLEAVLEIKNWKEKWRVLLLKGIEEDALAIVLWDHKSSLYMEIVKELAIVFISAC